MIKYSSTKKTSTSCDLFHKWPSVQTKVSSINYKVTANQDNWGILKSQGLKCISIISYKSNNNSMPFKILISIFRVKLEVQEIGVSNYGNGKKL